MEQYKPIIIAGFGRSGTTWLSDIVSKALGGLILFEPFHPSVFEFSKNYCYATHGPVNKLLDHWQVLNKDTNKERWLLRNHLRSPIEHIPQTYVDQIWEHTQIIGFKTIRINHLLHAFSSQLEAQLIYIVRHPLAVISSIQGRPRFWEEYGWDWHWKTFVERCFLSTNNGKRKSLATLAKNLSSVEEKITMMWAVSQILSIPQIEKQGGFLVRYEDLYTQPYQVSKSILEFLGHKEKGIHPAYIFEPSMTTLRTFHNQSDAEGLEYLGTPDIFWKHRFSSATILELKNILTSVFEIFETRPPILSEYMETV